jgi:hypothetical protein
MVELGAAGMCDGPPDTASSAERLRRLECSQAAWKISLWSQPKGFPYSKKIFPFPVALSGNLVALKGPICGSRRTGELLLLKLPSEARGIPEQLWNLDLGYERIEAISLDDSQDLLVFSRLVSNVESLFLTPTQRVVFSSLPNIHVRTLSSGCVHPLSGTHGLIDSGINYVEHESFSLRIHDDRLAFMSSVGRQILVWDWKTGKQIAKIASRFLGRDRAIY